MSLINRFFTWDQSISITREIGWWSLKSFSINSIQFNGTTNGNLFNSYLKGELTITGSIKGEHNSIPEIKNIHISERFEIRNNEQICVVNVSPIVKYNPDTTLMESDFAKRMRITNSSISEIQPILFKHSIPISLHSWQWGINTIVFVSGDQSHEITFDQSK